MMSKKITIINEIVGKQNNFVKLFKSGKMVLPTFGGLGIVMDDVQREKFFFYESKGIMQT